MAWYEATVGWKVLDTDLTWADAFGIFRGSVIMQGIAARYALRQASSEKAGDYAAQMKPFGEMGWDFIQELMRKMDGPEKARL